LLLSLLFPFTSYAPCELTGNQETNIGYGIYIDNPGYCYPAQSFIATGYSINDVEILVAGSSWRVEVYEGEFGSKLLGSSSPGYSTAYNVFARVGFSTPIATIPGSYYTIYPRGSGTWYFNTNNYFPSGRMAGMNPAGGCFSSGWDSAFHVNCGATAPGAWTCVPGIDCPIRLNSAGNVECMAQDGANCLWTPGNCAGTLASPPTTINPFTCGKTHYTTYGSYGYDSTTHWCYRGWEFLKPWLCLPGLSCPMRINSAGNPECLSNNGRDCLWNTVSCSTIQVYDASSISPINPLSCGSYHNSIYGITGYQDPNHWCFQTIKQLEPVCINNNQVSTCTGADCTGMRPCPLLNS